MVRLANVAAGVGVFAGAWNLYAYYFLECSSLSTCPAFTSTPPGLQGSLTAGLAWLLLLASFAEFIGPRSLFYLTAAFGLAIDVIELLNYSKIGPGTFYITVALVTASFFLSVVALRQRTGISEQSNPMNLPVFG